jgi:hypothetical protein
MGYYERLTVGQFDGGVRSPDGFAAGTRNSCRGKAPWVGNPILAHEFFDDFEVYSAASWTVTETQAGATQAATAADGGHLTLVNTGADNDLNAIQWPTETFKWEADKGLYIAARFHLSTAVEVDAAIGLTILDTSPIATQPSDGIYFVKADGAATLAMTVGKNGTYSSANIGSVVAATFLVAELVYVPEERRFYGGVNGQAASGVIASVANAPDDEELSCQIAVQNGDGNARTLVLDYILISKQR